MYLMNRFATLILCAFLCLTACQPDPFEGYESVNLLAQDIPVTVLAPPGAKVKKGDLGSVMKDVTVRGTDENAWYNLQVFASRSLHNSVETAKQSELENVKANPSFDQLIEEFPDGFVYRTSIDSLTNHNFRRVKVVGDQEVIFQTGLLGTFSEDEVRRMYLATE